MVKRDKLWKAILETRFKEFMLFFFADYQEDIDWVKPFEFLDKELLELFPKSSTGGRFVDKLVKIWLKDGHEQWILVHVEVQGSRSKGFPDRMFSYFYRLRDRFGVNVTAVALLTDGDKNWVPDHYVYTFMGTQVLFKYNTYKLAIQNREELAQSDNVFAVVMLVAFDVLHAAKDENSRLGLALALARKLLEKGYAFEEVKDVLLFLKYYVQFRTRESLQVFDNNVDKFKQQTNYKPMGVLETVIEAYREKGLKEGRRKGLKEGRQEGRQEGISIKEHDFVVRLWEHKEFSLSKIALLVGIPEERAAEIILEHLKGLGNTKEDALSIIAEYQTNFGG